MAGPGSAKLDDGEFTLGLGGPSGIWSPTLRCWSSGMMRSALGPFAGNRSRRPTARAVPAHLRQPGPDPIRRRVDRDGMGGHGHRVIGEVIAGQAAVALLFRGAVVMAGPLQRQIASNSKHSCRARVSSESSRGHVDQYQDLRNSPRFNIRHQGRSPGGRRLWHYRRAAQSRSSPPVGPPPPPSAASGLGPARCERRQRRPRCIRRSKRPGRGYVSPACKAVFASLPRNRGGTVRLPPGSSAREHVWAGRPPEVHGLVRADRVECPPDRVR